MQRHIIKNSIITPDGTILISKHRHNYNCYIDTINNKEYCVDGGLSYLRRIGNSEEYTENSVYSDDPHEKIREHFEWGTYGPDGTEGLHYILLKNMSNEHIENCLKTNLLDYIKQIFEDELVYRKKNK